MIPILLALQTATVPASADQRRAHCADLVATDPAAAEAEAGRWRISGGGLSARQCLGLALAAQSRFAPAADAFEAAARDAEVAKSTDAATYWAQAGNARLAAGDPARARTALDAALAGGTLRGLALGEARLDRARTLVAVDELDAARTDIDLALGAASDDPLAWLLSATLARRMRDTPRATKDIAEALKRSPDDAQVQLEAGNIAALRRDESGAKRAWAEAARLAPTAPAGQSARAALAQFATPEPR